MFFLTRQKKLKVWSSLLKLCVKVLGKKKKQVWRERSGHRSFGQDAKPKLVYQYTANAMGLSGTLEVWCFEALPG